MNEQSAQECSERLNEAERHGKVRMTFLRLLSIPGAFAAGWVLAFIFARVPGTRGSFLPFVQLFALLAWPLLLGIAAAFVAAPLTRERKIRALLIPYALGLGFLVIVGISAYWSPILSQQDAVTNASCALPGHECHVGGIGMEVFTIYVFLYGMALMLPGAIITGLIINRSRKKAN